MRNFFGLAGAVAGVLTLGTAFPATASAGCAPAPEFSNQTAHFIQAAYSPLLFRLVSDDGRPSIVGLWKFTFTSLGNANNTPPFNPPDGAPLDAGFVTWHSDGTEIMNSGRDPATSSFCLGTWRSSGPWGYTLNHFALSWDNTGHLCQPQGGAPSCFVGPANIREHVNLQPPGDTYTGTFTIDQYNASGTSLIFHLAGTIAAERITAN